MSAPEIGIKDLLVELTDLVFNTGSDFSMYIGRMPDLPRQCVVIKGFGGKPPNPKLNIDYPSVQVRVRANSTDYIGGSAVAKKIQDALLGLPSRDVNGDRWTAINMGTAIIYTGMDVDNCHGWTLNFDLIIEPSSAGHRET